MKKLSLLLYHREKERFVRELQQLGVVHIVEGAARDSAGGQDAATVARRCESAIKAMRALEAPTQAGAPVSGDGRAVLEQFEALESQLSTVDQELSALGKDESALAPWGEFDPSLIRTLADRGASIRFLKVASKKFGGVGTDGVLVEVGTDDGMVCLVMLGEGAVPEGAEEVALPAQPLSKVRARIAELRAERVSVQERLRALRPAMPAIEKLAAESTTISRFQTALHDFQPAASGTLLCLEGWFPARSQKPLEAFLGGFAAWYECSEPNEQDDVPVKVENGPVARLFEPIMRLYMLPSYREMDPTPLFTPFFVLFVGLCLGDLAYGILVFTGAMLAYFKAPRSFRPFASMVMVLGASVVVCGVLLNSCFGNALFGGPGIPQGTSFFASGVESLSPLSPLETEAGTLYPAMSFALLIGFLQMMFAMVLQAVNRFRLMGLRGIILPVSYILMLFGSIVWAAHANPFELGVGGFAVGKYEIGPLLLLLPAVAGPVMTWGGIGLLLLFNNPQKKIWWRPLTGLWDFYNFATGNLGYLLSYIRLFALGLCGGLLGATFNQMAFGLIQTDNGLNWISPAAIFTVLILVVGHALNFSLSLVGAFVHPLRLTFVEFYQTLQFSGGGREFAPLAAARAPGEKGT